MAVTLAVALLALLVALFALAVLTDRLGDHAPRDGIMRVDVVARAELFEGYAPTVLAVDAAGTVVARRFVYADTDVPALLRELTGRAAQTSQGGVALT